MNIIQTTNLSPRFLRMRYEKNQIKNTASSLGFMTLCYFAISFVLPYVAILLGNGAGVRYNSRYADFSGYSPLLYYTASGIIYLVALIVPTLFPLKMNKLSLKDAFPFQKNEFTLSLLLFLFGLAGCITAQISSSCILSFFELFGVDLSPTETPYQNDLASTLVYIFILSILPGIVEEFIFRGVVLGSLKKYGDFFAILVSSALFAGFHASLVQTLFAFSVGLILGFVRIKTNSLIVPILIHFSNNLISCVVTILGDFMTDVSVNMLYLLYMILAIFLGVIAVYCLKKYYIRVFSFKDARLCLNFSQRLFSLFDSPLFVISVVAIIIMTVLGHLM